MQKKPERHKLLEKLKKLKLSNLLTLLAKVAKLKKNQLPFFIHLPPELLPVSGPLDWWRDAYT